MGYADSLAALMKCHGCSGVSSVVFRAACTEESGV
jgi:hypothetical protein